MNSAHLSFGVKEYRRQTVRSARARSILGSSTLNILVGLIVIVLPLIMISSVHATDADDRRILAALDTKYQKAVEENDAKTMAAILMEDFVLVEGNGKRSTKAELLNSATDGRTHYEHQEDTEQTVMVSGDTAVVTAKLWAKGLEDGAKVDYMLWFSDVYIRTPKGWRYYFGQASLPLTTSPH